MMESPSGRHNGGGFSYNSYTIGLGHPSIQSGLLFLPLLTGGEGGLVVLTDTPVMDGQLGSVLLEMVNCDRD